MSHFVVFSFYFFFLFWLLFFSLFVHTKMTKIQFNNDFSILRLSTHNNAIVAPMCLFNCGKFTQVIKADGFFSGFSTIVVIKRNYIKKIMPSLKKLPIHFDNIIKNRFISTKDDTVNDSLIASKTINTWNTNCYDFG